MQNKPPNPPFFEDFKAVIVALVIFAAAGLIGIKAFAQDMPVPAAESSATQAVIADQLQAFRSKDHARAYSHAAPNIKGYFDTVDKFAAMVSRGYGAIYSSRNHVFGRNTIINKEIYQEVIITDRHGNQWQAVYTLKQQEDGSWKITGVKMNPYKGAAV
ncbi:DUF4864 domain-containing protein [Salaquimonas pukyongi]|uniref:DUF4864 domain-containing protein n=1 Tax=Salaquimonas pukyongi TaxID=2712698 RepID=UPI0009F9F702|nr:DUF4864 domain-containing protein [Salaquimonas pukyongi]